MKVKLLSKEGTNVIPTDEVLEIHTATVGNSAIIANIENGGYYRTSAIQRIGVVGEKVLIETRNTKYEFELVK